MPHQFSSPAIWAKRPARWAIRLVHRLFLRANRSVAGQVALLAACLFLIPLLAACGGDARPTAVPPAMPETVATAVPEPVTLTLGSWRIEDVEAMNRILRRFSQIYPHITITYDPIVATEYDSVLRAQLAAGQGPDLFYLRSFSISRALYDGGFLAELTDVPGVMDAFSAATRSPWATDSGSTASGTTEESVPYGVPFIATSHGAYYNQNIFAELGLSVPTTWADLLAAARTIQAAGYIPFANASGDTWTVAELMFMNLAPNFIGGREGRLAYLAGERCFNDAQMVAAFQALADLAPFLPPGQAFLTYADSQQLFLQGRAAMWLGGSWDIPFFEAAKPDFEWSIFAPPPPAGQPAHITFHLDAGMGLNAASAHPEAAKLFLAWMATPEFGQLLGDELPGFFPMHQNPPALSNQHANTFLGLNQGRGTDVRFVWDKLRDGDPSAYDLVMNAGVDVIRGRVTPQEAADMLQTGLAAWFPPAQTCERQ